MARTRRTRSEGSHGATKRAGTTPDRMLRRAGPKASGLHLVVLHVAESYVVPSSIVKQIIKQSGIERKHRGDRSLANWSWSQQVDHKTPKLFYQAQALYIDYIQEEPDMVNLLCNYMAEMATMHAQCEPLSMNLSLRRFPSTLTGIWQEDSASSEDPDQTQVVQGRIKRRRLNPGVVNYRCNSTDW